MLPHTFLEMSPTMTNLSSIRFQALSSNPPKAQLSDEPSTRSKSKAYGIDAVGVQNYLPVQEKRQLTPEEQVEIRENLSNWLPTLFPSYGTKAPELLADPVKTGVLTGGLTGTVTGGLAGAMQLLFAHGDVSGITALVAGGVGAVTGLLSGVMSYFRRNQENSDIIDLMKRLPPGATKRDLLADPVYQQDQQVAQLSRGGTAGNGVLNTALTAGILASVLDRRRD
jgi:hypothetical protein